MFLYNSYCYADLKTAADSLYSTAYINGFGVLQNYFITGVDTIELNFLMPVVVGKSYILVPASVNYIFHECTALGFNNSFFGIDFETGLDLTWRLIAILVSAYGIREVKKMLGW